MGGTRTGVDVPDGAAVVSAIFAAEDIEEETRRLRAAVQAALGA